MRTLLGIPIMSMKKKNKTVCDRINESANIVFYSLILKLFTHIKSYCFWVLAQILRFFVCFVFFGFWFVPT